MYPVLVQAVNGRFEASVFGAPGHRVEGATKEAAVEALRADLEGRHANGELVWVSAQAASGPAGRPEYTDEDRAEAEEMIAELYRERDAQKAAEFPE